MKKTNLLLSFIIILFLTSCEKSLDSDMTTSYQVQEVKKGQHFCGTCGSLINIKSFKGGYFKALVKMDTSLFVHNEGGQQNKFVGFYEDNIHQNSARISYHTISHPTNKHLDSLELKTYVYNSGARNLSQNYKLITFAWNQVKDMLINKDSIEVNIKILDDQYLYQINNLQEVSVTRTCGLKPDTIKYLARHYYGGPDSIPAPHNMKLWIKYDKIME